MAARLPVPGGDDGDWGDVLNGFLEVSLNGDGTLKSQALITAGGVTSVNTITPQANGNVTLTAANVGAYTKPSGGIPSTDMTSAVQTSLGLANTSIQLGGDIGGTTTSPIVSKLQGVTLNGSSPSSGQVLSYNGTQWVPSTISSATINDATTTSKGILQLSGDLSGTASSPTVTGTHLTSALPVNQGGTGSASQNFVDLTTDQSIGGVKTFTDKVSVAALQVTTGTPASGNVLTSDASGNATWQAPLPANRQNVATKTSSYLLTTNDEVVLADASGGTLTLTLPTAAGNTNLYAVKKIDSSGNAVTVATTGGQTIDGGASAVIQVQYASISVISDGANWFII